ncbi:hypothetical protein GGF46_000206 [Coemansia sp. RSA 552]|nr:hypothetical protein GGF46_000206 [Coemansia sp. RSA 552]
MRRMAISPIGESIYTVRSVGKLIRVLYKVMCCHMDTYRKCGITHRDISDNNVLVVRVDGVAYGLLIDYGCAFDKNAESSTRPMCTGTLPFMSISNLEVSDTERTILDDWESLLYLICVLGTMGIVRQRKVAAARAPPIFGWFNDSAGEIARDKRMQMDSKRCFNYLITGHFYDDDDDRCTLAKLAKELRECLFNNEHLWDVKYGQGAIKRTDRHMEQRFDPLKIRAEYADVIGEQLLEILKAAADKYPA